MQGEYNIHTPIFYVFQNDVLHCLKLYDVFIKIYFYLYTLFLYIIEINIFYKI